ncbi:hypothetical protein [Bifidobacterium choloepi]|uniref:Transcriptional regulator n=1 Tax=Bifidobacterium choloepi TaxID=2614131 RepID=A0A6I5NK91_9BIFI|nr:hypothetical protein [Bifidobacterium choloepi]NEG69272.1 hypothetical protein [Bifidobacterium choloepi]
MLNDSDEQADSGLEGQIDAGLDTIVGKRLKKPNGPVNGYEWHMKRHAKYMAAGFAVIFGGLSIGDFLKLVPERSNADTQVVIDAIDKLVGKLTRDVVELPTVQAHPESFIVEMLALFAGGAILYFTIQDNDDYRTVFNHITRRYTPAQVRAARRSQAAWLATGAAIIAGVNALLVLLAQSWPTAVTSGLSSLSIAVGLAMILYSYYWGGRVNVGKYNFHAMRFVNIYQLSKNEEGRDERINYDRIAEKQLSYWANVLGLLAIVIGVGAALALYCLPTLKTPYFWIPLAVMLVVGLVVRWIVDDYAIRKFEGADDDVKI